MVLLCLLSSVAAGVAVGRRLLHHVSGGYAHAAGPCHRFGTVQKTICDVAVSTDTRLWARQSGETLPLGRRPGTPHIPAGNSPRARFTACWVLFPPVAWPFMGASGGSGVFDALQIEGLPISPERVELRDFRALEAVAFAHLQAVQTVAAGSRLAGFYAAAGE